MGSKEIELSGQIERITFTNEENGYTIAKVKIHGRQDLVTVVGYLMSPTPGEMLNMKGEWVNHPKFGEQFNVTEYKTTVPATIFGIQKYLGSGLIKGIGPVMAKRIVKKFEKVGVKGGIWLSRNSRIFLTPGFYSCYHAAEELGG